MTTMERECNVQQEQGATPSSGPINLGPIAQVPPGEGRVFRIGEERIAVFHSRNGAVYATQAECPHLGGPLADGMLGGAILVCPLHNWKFDLTTGQPLFGDCALKIYPVALTAEHDILLG